MFCNVFKVLVWMFIGLFLFIVCVMMGVWVFICLMLLCYKFIGINFVVKGNIFEKFKNGEFGRFFVCNYWIFLDFVIIVLVFGCFVFVVIYFIFKVLEFLFFMLIIGLC